jgi:hypothetical protein
MEKQGSQYGYTPLTRRARGVVYPQDVEMPDTRICELLGKGDFLQLIVTGSIEHQVVRIHLFTKPLRKGNHGIIFDYNGILTMQTYPITPPNEFALHSSLSPFEVKPEAIETFTKLLALAVRLA